MAFELGVEHEERRKRPAKESLGAERSLWLQGSHE